MKTLPSPSTVSPQNSTPSGEKRDVVGGVARRRDHRERPDAVAVAELAVDHEALRATARRTRSGSALAAGRPRPRPEPLAQARHGVGVVEVPVRERDARDAAAASAAPPDTRDVLRVGRARIDHPDPRAVRRPARCSVPDSVSGPGCRRARSVTPSGIRSVPVGSHARVCGHARRLVCMAEHAAQARAGPGRPRAAGHLAAAAAAAVARRAARERLGAERRRRASCWSTPASTSEGALEELERTLRQTGHRLEDVRAAGLHARAHRPLRAGRADRRGAPAASCGCTRATST